MSALTTADLNPHIASYHRNIMDYATAYIGDVNSFKMYKFTSPVTTIDLWMEAGISSLNLKDIVAIKIDTEGYEGRVLQGAENLLATQKPLIMAELGHLNVIAVETALSHGYAFAEREGDQLRVSNQPTNQVNGFFVHPEKASFYRHIGLLKG